MILGDGGGSGIDQAAVQHFSNVTWVVSPKKRKPGATLHGANLRRAGAIDRLPLY
jgi:hypothetical protein